MLGQVFLLALASLLASGVLFRHRGILTYLAAAGVLWEAQWLLITLLDHQYVIGAMVLLIAWVSQYKKFTFPRFQATDIPVAAVTVVVLVASWLIFQFNSFEPGAWVTHGFLNGDTATLIAITEKAKLAGGLVRENPFAANGPLEYPSLLHAGLASLNFQPQYLPGITYLQIILTVPVFFLLFERKNIWLEAGIILYVLALSWESFVYPQGHFFLMGMFVLMVSLLMNPKLPHLGMAVILGIVLLFSNAVTGTAATLLKIIYDGLQAIQRGKPIFQRLGWLVGVAFWIVLFWLFTPGNGSFGLMPSFSYTAAAEMGRLAPILILVLIGVLLNYERKLFTSAATLGLTGLALITFVFSTRDIVIENASRFFYHAILVAFPLTISPLTRAYYWFRREFLLSSRTFIEKLVGWGCIVVFLVIFLLPAGASVASTHDNLMFKDEQIITREIFEKAETIKNTTPFDAVIPGSPDPPFWIPMLTGRALERTNFWLSPEQRGSN